MRRLKTVLHVHTYYSFDSNARSEDIVAAARRDRVDCVAITDHDAIAGALETRQLGGVEVIVGEEISSRDGHIIGLFLQECIPPGLTAEQTIDRIRAQGGLVLIPHPAGLLCDNSMSWRTLKRIRPLVDAIETCNAQNPVLWEDVQARRFSRRHNLTPYVGADAHVSGYLAGAYQWMAPFNDAPSFLNSLRQAELCPGRFGPGYFLQMAFRHFWDKFHRRRLPGYGARFHPAPIDARADDDARWPTDEVASFDRR